MASTAKQARDLRKIGKSAYASIAEMVEALNARPQSEERCQAIEEDPLSIEVRSGWHSLGEEAGDEEFCILLATGGPAVRIIGELDRDEPTKARLEVQDWFTPWTEYAEADESVLLDYCRVFCWETGR